jgi:ABC-type multidrug transport system fused ATPase/permease subunit
VIEEGRITAMGTYEELLKNSPTFQHLHQLQFFDISEAAVAARSHA